MFHTIASRCEVGITQMVAITLVSNNLILFCHIMTLQLQSHRDYTEQSQSLLCSHRGGFWGQMRSIKKWGICTSQ